MSDDRGESGVSGCDDRIKSMTSTMSWKCEKLGNVTGIDDVRKSFIVRILDSSECRLKSPVVRNSLEEKGGGLYILNVVSLYFNNLTE